MLIPVFLLPSCDTSSWMTQLESLFCFYVTESKPFILSQLEYVRKIASAAVQTRDRMRSDKPFNAKRVRISSEEGVGGGVVSQTGTWGRLCARSETGSLGEIRICDKSFHTWSASSFVSDSKPLTHNFANI